MTTNPTDLPAREGLATVQRFSLVSGAFRDHIEPMKGGEYVMHADYAALLARVAELEAEVLRWQSINAANITLHRDRAEAAEQVAREAVGLLREARDMMANVPSWEPVSSRAAAFLAHHGARTGEGGES